MIAPRKPAATVRFIDDYCDLYKDIFPEVRTFEAFKYLHVGNAYTIWTGIGSVGTVVLGIVLFGESAKMRRLSCIALIVAGMVGLRLISSH